MRILVVDDNAACASCFGETLREAGFVVDVSANLAEADDSVSVATYDAILVDRMLPDGDGLDWIRSQRRGGGTVPMLIVSAERDEVDHRIEGLNAGADDYMVKPVPLDELVARVRAVLRRPAAILNPVLQAGNVEFDPSNREVRVDGKALRMPRRETCIFEMLIRRVGKTVTKSLLEEGLYSFEDEVSANAIEVGVYRLRGHLMGSSATVSVRTVRGTGYVLEPHDVPIVAPQVPQAALIAAQVAVALVNDGSSTAPALPAIAASLSSMQAHETNVAVVAAALAVSMAVVTDDDAA